MAGQSTTMWNLCSAIKTKLLTFQNTTLSPIRCWKSGFFSPACAFPVLAILPVSEDYFGYKSGQQYRVNRRINIEVYSKIAFKKVAEQQTQHLISAVKDIVQANVDWSDNCIDTKMSTEVYPPGDEYQASIISLECLSLETMPTTTESTTVAEVDSDDLMETIYTTINGYKTSGSPSLSNIPTIYRSYDNPPAKMPSILILGETLDRSRHWTGQDNPTRNFRVVIRSALHEKETNLQRNIAIVEDVKDIIQANYRWGGKAWNTLIKQILYEADTTSTQMAYETSVIFETQGVEPL